MSRESNRGRVRHFDMLRGIAIIFVVIIHSSNMGLQFSSDSFNFTVLSRELINIAVLNIAVLNVAKIVGTL